MCFSFIGHHQMSLGGGTLPNKFEQVSSDHQHMSLAEGSPGLMSRGKGHPTWSIRGGIPYHVTYSMMHMMLPTPSPTWTDRCLWKHYLPPKLVFSLSGLVGMGLHIYMPIDVSLRLSVNRSSYKELNELSYWQKNVIFCKCSLYGLAYFCIWLVGLGIMDN